MQIRSTYPEPDGWAFMHRSRWVCSEQYCLQQWLLLLVAAAGSQVTMSTKPM